MTVALTMELVLTSLATTIIIVMGWYVAHRLSSTRDLANKRREPQVNYLIEAYRRLESASNRGPSTNESFIEVEKAMADIQLFGTATQVKLVHDFCSEFVEKRTGLLDPLLNDLRKSLRKELNLESVPLNTVFLRYDQNSNQVTDVPQNKGSQRRS